ncbi:MAG: hypothetical protein RIR53_1424 [Bacteroidota bacterium]
MSIEFHIGRRQRLHDNPRLVEACHAAEQLLPVYDWDPSIEMRPHRASFLLESLRSLQRDLRVRGSDLLFRLQRPADDVAHVYRQSETLYHHDDLPMSLDRIPRVFTSFRRELERSGTRWRAPVPAVEVIPALPDGVVCPDIPSLEELGYERPVGDARSAFPFHRSDFAPSESSAREHLQRYLESQRIDSYKQTRNQLVGTEFSSKLSPWLALGIISARTVAEEIHNYECRHGANDGTYWLWFELVWRDFFAFRAHIEPSEVIHAQPPELHRSFWNWCTGNTGNAFVDAGMNELNCSGWMSNRMRQIVASYLINELQCPWQWGEWWFAVHLIDYDPASNEGNWRYIAGEGADPRGGRRFDIAYQQRTHDPMGSYTSRWRSS